MNRSPEIAKHPGGWRAPILEYFTPEIAKVVRLTIVMDPDHLLTEQEILAELIERGFELVPFDDHVAFRFAYESRYRQAWDRGEETNLVVVLRSASGNLDSLPYDLLEQAKHQERCLSFSVGELFPKLVPNVVLDLDRSCFDTLFEAQAQEDSERLGVDATKDFVLRHVFEIAPELIKNDANLMQVLLKRHYRGLSFPEQLDQRFIRLLNKGNRWNDWPLQEIIPHRAAFLLFLDERWPSYVRQMAGANSDQVVEPPLADEYQYPGPQELPFGHDDVKVYIDNLFQEGYLNPIAGYSADQMPEEWMRVGVRGQDRDDRFYRFERLLRRLEDECPGEDVDHHEWVQYAQTWAEWTALRWQLSEQERSAESENCEILHDRIEDEFSKWMKKKYAALHNLSSFNRPAMVHHIAHHIGHRFVPTGEGAADGGPPKKYALLIVDGLALDQWVVLRDTLKGQLSSNVQIEEDGTFAWVPTLTGVSRQAIFAGKPPMYFATSIGSTSKEKTMWSSFWESKGATKSEVDYVREGKDQPDSDFLEKVITAAEHPRMRLLGVIIGKIDRMIHGAVTGSAGLHGSVKHWANDGAMKKLIEALLEQRYEIFLTADHGNIEASGIGKPDVGVVADERGERAHIFNDQQICENEAEKFSGTMVWPTAGLPKDYHTLLAPQRGAFVPAGRQIVCHGGIAMEEVIVPWVTIRRNQ